MNTIKPDNINLIQCVDVSLYDKNSDYLVAFNLYGFKLDRKFIQRVLNNTQLNYFDCDLML